MDCCRDRLTGAKVYVIDGNHKQLCGTLPSSQEAMMEVGCGAAGSKVIIQIPGYDKVLSLAEVEVWGTLED